MADTFAASTQRRRRPWWFRILRGLLIVSLVLLGVGLVPLVLAFRYDAAGRSEWDRALAEARADGKPFTLADLEAARKTWPDQANGALIIVGLTDRLDTIRDQVSKEDLPIVGGNESNGLFPLGQRWDSATDQAVARRLQEWAPVLAQIDRLRDFEGGRFALEIKPCPLDTLLPNLAPLRLSAKLKALDATWRAMHGQTDTLPEDVAVLLRLGQLLANEPALISSLSRMAIDSLAVTTVESVSAQGGVPADKLIAVERLLASIDTDYLGQGLRGERASFIGLADWYRIHGGLPGVVVSRTPPGWPVMRGYVLRDQAVGLRMHNRIVAVADKPAEAAAAAGAMEREVMDLPEGLSFTHAIMPSLKRTCELAMRATAGIRAARVGLAAERYRIDAGSFPAKLDNLVPKYLDQIPVDPFDGRPLRYKLTPEQACIYSVGDDLKDNGGRLREPLPNTEERDFGFRLLPPALRGRASASGPATTPAGPMP